MASQIIVRLVIGITCLRLLMTCPIDTTEAEDGSCVDCPAGYRGINCSVRCDNKTYGAGCTKSCDCTAQYCDSIIGCIQLPITASEAAEVTTENLQTGVNGLSVKTDSLTFELLMINLFLVGCNLLFTVATLCTFMAFLRKWQKDQERRETGNLPDSTSKKSDNFERSDSMEGEVIELHSDEYEPPIVPTERPVDNVYTGIQAV